MQTVPSAIFHQGSAIFAFKFYDQQESSSFQQCVHTLGQAARKLQQEREQQERQRAAEQAAATAAAARGSQQREDQNGAAEGQIEGSCGLGGGGAAARGPYAGMSDDDVKAAIQVWLVIKPNLYRLCCVYLGVCFGVDDLIYLKTFILRSATL